MTIEEIKEKLDAIITSPYGVKNVLIQLSGKNDNEKIKYLKDILNGDEKVDNTTKPGGANG